MKQAKKKVLIVDDDQVVSSVIKTIAEKHDTEASIAIDGRKAQEIIGAEKFDLIFLDLLIPHSSGWDVLNFIRKNPGTENVPVVIVTGVQISDEEKKRFSNKVTTFISKETFSLAEFESLLDKLLSDTK